MGNRITNHFNQTTITRRSYFGMLSACFCLVMAMIMTISSVLTVSAATLTAGGSEAAENAQAQSSASDKTGVSFEADHFSVYAIVSTLENTLHATDGQTYRVTVTYTENAQIPAGSRLIVSEISGEAYEEYTVKAAEAIGAQTGFISYAKFIDITIMNGDQEIQPASPVDVKISLLTEDAVENENKTEATPQVVHFGEEVQVLEPATKAVAAEAAAANGEAAESVEVSFAAEGFSVYGVVYTVDFEYAVNGKVYQLSIAGGDCISFTKLVQALGIIGAENNDEQNDTQNVESKADASAEFEAKKFVADVVSVEFSSPALVDVSKVERRSTVGQLKADRNLKCEYSAELTEKQIEAINAQVVEEGDWALISLLPFTSEETLTVTMKGGEVFTIRVTDAQISAHVMTAEGERFRITVNFDEAAKIPEGAYLVAEEIPAGSEAYEKYLEESAKKWAEADREEYISFARFFDIEIRKDDTKIEPAAPVEVEIVHEDGLALNQDENLSVIHFADKGTEIIDQLHRNENSTQVVYEQGSFSVIGTVSTVKESGWPTANGQYVLVLQDGEDYYALKQDGTLTKVRFFNNTVSFTGEGTTTTDYIHDYLWYVVSSGNRGKIANEYIEYNATPAGQTFIDLNNAAMLSGTSRQLQIRDGKIYCSGQLPGSSAYTQVTLSAAGGQLTRVALTSEQASPAFFATASTFTANDNETDLFTQVEVETIVEKWKEQKTQKAVYDKTAEVYDYENRIYQIDITASSSDFEVSPSIALEFVVDASRSMFFPTSLTEVGTFTGTNASNVRDWINAHGDTDQVYFVIQDKNGKATQYAIFFDPNSAYQVKTGSHYDAWSRRWVDDYETRYGQWRWVDASNYNPPDDTANGGNSNSRQEGKLLSDWNAGSLDDGKIYTTGITGSSNGTYGERKTWISRIEYLKQCVRVASQVIYTVDEDAQIGLVGFNANTTDYGTFGKSEQQTLLNKLDNISLAGGTNHQGGLQKAIDKYQDKNYYKAHYAGRKHVVVLVTDGAPNASGVNWTSIGKVANTLKGLKDDFGHNTELYTMGLSLTNVGSNQTNLFGISSGEGYTYAGEDAAQIINAVTKMVDGIFVQAHLIADVTDVIDPAFYPVNKADGLPLSENDWISLNGTKVSEGNSDAAGQIKKDETTGNWYVQWKDQNIDWPTLDANGAIAEAGWHGCIFIKAKEDFLGGNGISTNAAGSQLEATKYIVRGETKQRDLPEGDHTTVFETPYVNVDELDITKNDTEWTVYLGTSVDPLKELKALWNEVTVKEVVTETAEDHRISSNGQMTYTYASDVNDNRAEANAREEFPITDLITLTDDDWADLVAGNAKIFEYNAYDHTKVGTIMVSLTQETAEGEKDLTESPHDTTVTGEEVEKYTLTVSYRPAGANIANWHTGSYGSGMSGTRAGNISKDNTHIINVFAKGLQITKVDFDDKILTGAKFALYRTAREGETDLMEINGGQYFKVAELDTSATGIAVKEQIEQLKENEQYYLVETQTPDGYNTIDPILVNLTINNAYTPKSKATAQAVENGSEAQDAESGAEAEAAESGAEAETAESGSEAQAAESGAETQTTESGAEAQTAGSSAKAQTEMPESGIFNWTQTASLVLNAESGIRQTNADNTEDLTHSVSANSNSEIMYYRVINNPGIELPHTGGAGTGLVTLLGSLLALGAGLLLIARRRLA